MKPTVGKNDSTAGQGNRVISRYQGTLTIKDPKRAKAARKVVMRDPGWSGTGTVKASSARSFSKRGK